ncbi:unnamed protein product [Adineta steineri]|uniref:Uncharacterized protein n=1 Tax=Adineta steineri TaxID=433720 RepID=A0A819QZU1_9BILA|nr:unnamed protein product [Adineta steineri]CAF3801961.1 unnamed protein product [Adineta steineri]CAF4034021.1 unnamed protein product [Adineta steineri]
MQRAKHPVITVQRRIRHSKKSKRVSIERNSENRNSQNTDIAVHNNRISQSSLKVTFSRQRAILSEIDLSSIKVHQKLNQKKNSNRKRSIRRFGFLICTAIITCLLFAIIAAVAIVATQIKTIPSTITAMTTTTETTTTTITITTETTSTTSVSSPISSTTASSTSTSLSTSTLSTILAYSSTFTSSTNSTTSITTIISTSTTTTESTTKTTTTTSPSTTTFSCTSPPPQSVAKYETDTVTNWTQYIYNYTATTTFPILIFGVDASAEIYIMIDDVSVVDITGTSVELLKNSDFEYSSTTLTGWSVWCKSTCNSGDGGTIYTSNCRLSSNCYKSQCRSSIDYLVQSFSTIIGRIYTISFWFQRLRSSSSGGSAKLYVGII